MPTYAPPQQVLVSPVTSLYQGKAMRQQLAEGELDLQIKQRMLDAPPTKEEARAEAKALREQAKFEAEQADAAREQFAEKMLAWTYTYDALIKSDGEEAASGYFLGQLQSIYENIPDGPERDELGKILEDGVISAEEVATARNESNVILKQFKGAAKGDRTAQKFIDSKGIPVQGSMDKDGNYYDASGERRTDLTPIAPAATQADLGGVSRAGLNKNIAEFKTATKGAVGAVQTATELLEISYKDPEALGKPGAILKFGNEMLVTAQAMMTAAGYEELKASEKKKQSKGAEAFNFDSFDVSFMKNTAIESTAFRAGIYGIAFAAAVAEQGTRPTDVDIQQFIDQVGGNSSDPVAFRRTITQFMRRQDNRLHTIAEIDMIPQEHQAAAFGVWDRAYDEFRRIARLPEEAALSEIETLPGYAEASQVEGFDDMSPEEQMEFVILVGAQ